MAYTLIGSWRSPFVRMNRLFLINNKVDFQFKAINFLEVKEDAEYLKTVNPINKVPIFLDGEQKIFDSRVIFNHITQKHKLRSLTLDEENILTAIHSCMDVSVNLFLLSRGGMDLTAPHPYILRQQERIPSSLEFILPWVKKQDLKNSGGWNYLTMALYCYLDWAIFRNLLDISKYPDLAAFVEKFKTAPGVAETDFRNI